MVNSHAASTMWGAFSNSYAIAVTNPWTAYPVLGATANANGSWTIGGPARRITPASNGYLTNTFAEGNYLLTNSAFGNSAIVFRAPSDGTHNIHSNRISGYNTFVTIVWGTNPPPTSAEITNALGIADLIGGTTVTNGLSVYSNSLYASILAATNSGISAVTATNASITQAAIATNSLSGVLVTRITNATNDLNSTLVTRIGNATNDLNTVLRAVINDSTNSLSGVLVTRITNATNDLNSTLTTRITNATNDLSSVLTTRITNATNDLNSTLTTRITNATNSLDTVLRAVITGSTNGLSATLITQIASGSSNGVVAVRRASGTFTNFHPTADTAVARGTALTNARATAVAGETIFIGPGTFQITNYTGSLLKAGVNIEATDGTLITMLDSGAGNGFGMLDDRHSGATTNYIRGGIWRLTQTPANNGVPSNPANGLLRITNANSEVSFHPDEVQLGTHNQLIFAAAYVENCRRVDFRTPRILDLYQQTTITDPDAVGTLQAQSIGVYWNVGEMYVDVSEIKVSTYAVWCDKLPGAWTNNLWATGDRWQTALAGDLASPIYISSQDSVNAPQWRTWIQVKEADQIGAGGGGAVAYYIGTGRHYLSAQKLGARGTDNLTEGIVVGSGSAGLLIDVWADVQKVSSRYAAVAVEPGGSLAGQVHDIEPVQIIGAPRIRVTGGTLNLTGRKLLATNGVGIAISGGTNRISGYTVNTEGGTNAPVYKSGGTLHLDGMLLQGPATTNSITADNAQTVSIYNVFGNQPNNANITLAANAGFTAGTNTTFNNIYGTLFTGNGGGLTNLLYTGFAASTIASISNHSYFATNAAWQSASNVANVVSNTLRAFTVTATNDLFLGITNGATHFSPVLVAVDGTPIQIINGDGDALGTILAGGTFSLDATINATLFTGSGGGLTNIPFTALSAAGALGVTNAAIIIAGYATNGYNAIATNIAAYQALLATNTLPTRANVASAKTLTNSTDVAYFNGGVLIVTNNTGTGGDFQAGGILARGNIGGSGSLLTNVPFTALSAAGRLGVSNAVMSINVGTTNLSFNSASNMTYTASNILWQAKIDATNALYQEITNQFSERATAPGWQMTATTNTGVVTLSTSNSLAGERYNIGANPFTVHSSNYVAMYNAGSTAANGTYWISHTNILYTNLNAITHLTNIAGTWFCKSNDVPPTVLYSSATYPTNAAWTIVDGVPAQPQSFFGGTLNLEGVEIFGQIKSTNLTAAIATAIASSLPAGVLTNHDTRVWTNLNGTLQVGNVRITNGLSGWRIVNEASADTNLFVRAFTNSSAVSLMGGLLTINTAAAAAVTEGQVNFTQTLSGSTASSGILMNITGAGSTGGQQALRLLLNAGYTGSSSTIGVLSINSSAGTGANANTAAYNAGAFLNAGATTAGMNVGALASANGGNFNAGLLAQSVTTKASATNSAVVAYGTNNPTGAAVMNAGYFALTQPSASVPASITNATLILQSGTTGFDNLMAMEGTLVVFRIAAGGGAMHGTNIYTGSVAIAPSDTATPDAWMPITNAGTRYYIPLYSP